MGLSSLASLLLCVFAGLLLAARRGSSPAQAGLIAAGFIGGCLVTWSIEPGNTALSMLAGGAVAAALLGWLRPRMTLILSGLVVGAAAASVFPPGSGWLVLPAWTICLAAVLASNALAQRQGRFAPAILLDQGSCALVIAAPVIAAMPAAQAGWKSALALAGTSAAVDAPPLEGWLVLPAIALLCGAMRQWWCR